MSSKKKHQKGMLEFCNMHSFTYEFIYSPLTRQVSLTASCGLCPVQGAGETGRPFACPYGTMDTNPVAQTQVGLKRGKAGKERNGMEQGAVGAGGRGAGEPGLVLAGREGVSTCLWLPPAPLGPSLQRPIPGNPSGSRRSLYFVPLSVASIPGAATSPRGMWLQAPPKPPAFGRHPSALQQILLLR